MVLIVPVHNHLLLSLKLYLMPREKGRPFSVVFLKTPAAEGGLDDSPVRGCRRGVFRLFLLSLSEVSSAVSVRCRKYTNKNKRRRRL